MTTTPIIIPTTDHDSPTTKKEMTTTPIIIPTTDHGKYVAYMLN